MKTNKNQCNFFRTIDMAIYFIFFVLLGLNLMDPQTTCSFEWRYL